MALDRLGYILENYAVMDGEEFSRVISINDKVIHEELSIDDLKLILNEMDKNYNEKYVNISKVDCILRKILIKGKIENIDCIDYFLNNKFENMDDIIKILILFSLLTGDNPVYIKLKYRDLFKKYSDKLKELLLMEHTMSQFEIKGIKSYLIYFLLDSAPIKNDIDIYNYYYKIDNSDKISELLLNGIYLYEYSDTIKKIIDINLINVLSIENRRKFNTRVLREKIFYRFNEKSSSIVLKIIENLCNKGLIKKEDMKKVNKILVDSVL